MPTTDSVVGTGGSIPGSAGQLGLPGVDGVVLSGFVGLAAIAIPLGGALLAIGCSRRRSHG